MKWPSICLFHILIAISTASGQDGDSLRVRKGFKIILPDTSFVTDRDTTIVKGHGTRVKEDPYKKSVQFYDTLGERAARRKLTWDLHNLIIRGPAPGIVPDSAILSSEDYFRPYTGLTIRSIHIVKVDLLEGSVLDTTLRAMTRVGKLVNSAHVETRDFIIRNNLMVKVGDPVDPFRLADSERILRQLKTIRDARIYLKTADSEPGAVDVIVVTQDVASTGASGGYSSLQNFRVDVYDINILGYAKQLQVSYFRNSEGRPSNGYEVILRQQNMGRSFVQGELKYTNNFIRNKATLSLGRDFITPTMKYAGGIEVFKTKENHIVNRNDTASTPFTQESLDVWAGRSIQISARTNLILAARSSNFHFTDRPFVSADSNHFFFRRSLILGSVTLFKTGYVKGSLVNGFGKTEDIPVNSWIGLQLGREHNEFAQREYGEFRSGTGKYFDDLGYFSTDLSIGGFRKHGAPEDGLVSVTGLYFSNLFKIKKTRARQFVHFSFIQGFRRTVVESVGIPGSWRDPAGLVPLGSQRTTLGLETIYFTPWYYYGFRFAFYHGSDVHFLRMPLPGAGDLHVFTNLKGGIRMLNDNLVFPTLSIDLNYYVRSDMYRPSFSIGVSTTLPRLFGTPQRFKPEIAPFQ